MNCTDSTQGTAANLDELREWREANNSASCGAEVITMEDAWHYIRILPLVPAVSLRLSIQLQGLLKLISSFNPLLPSAAFMRRSAKIYILI